MSWQQLLAANRVRRHVTSQQELNDLRAVIARDLQDAALVVHPAIRYTNCCTFR